MYDFIESIYSGYFMVFVICISLILFHILKILTRALSTDNEIRDGYVLVTGCDSGFGFGAAMEFNRKDFFVFAGCLTEEGLERFYNDDNFNGKAIPLDITKKEDIYNAKKIIEEKVGSKGLWCLLNNAGVSFPGPIEWLSEDDMKRSMDVNLWGAVNVTKTMLPLIKMSRGRIVITTSMIGRICNLSSYQMAKYALEAFSDTLRHEMRAWGISVHIIEFGIFRFNIFDAMDKRCRDLWAMQPTDIKEAYGKQLVEETLEYTDKIFEKLIGDPKQVRSGSGCKYHLYGNGDASNMDGRFDISEFL